MRNYIVVLIGCNTLGNSHPHNAKYPHLVDELRGNDEAVFVVNVDDHEDFYPGDEFFLMIDEPLENVGITILED